MDGLVPGSSAVSALSSRPTRFFGREAELAGLHEAVERDRLVTLVGAPGCGKTRLATEAGARLAARFAGGVHVAELAHVGDPNPVVNAVAAAVGAHEQPGRPRLETLIETLAPAELLLVIDNCEHVVEPVADLVVEVLAACPTGVLTARDHG